jgi:WD40 repeat protein/tRNA A-37 threonylcarbamoyl transferase component Bud32
MIAADAVHPDADQLRAFNQGLLAPAVAAVIEEHVAACESCCQLLETPPADSFVSRLRDADRVPAATTAAGQADGTLAVVADVPADLADHPRYRVLGLIGQGGMGAVYRAEHRRMERTVALKVINPGLLQNPATVQRFQQEVRTAARLHHPNIVTAYDADQAGTLHFLVMEHVEGRSLAEVVAEYGPLPVAVACEYVRQAALGLQHAHEQGMVHRDIKPHNLMVSQPASGGCKPPVGAATGGLHPPLAGTVKILDFGLARLARSPETTAGPLPQASAVLTGAGAVMGTADYIAPEQAADPRTADIRADIYSLGCTLFHLLTGRPPFEGGTVQEKLARHAAEPLPPMPGVPAGLAAVLARATAKDPAARYATPAALADALAAFIGSTAVHRRIMRRRRWVATAAVLLVAGIMAVGLILRIPTERGDIVLETDDPSLELLVQRAGGIVHIRDAKSGKTLKMDTKGWRLDVDDWPGGLKVELPGRGTIKLHRQGGGKVTITTGPKGVVPAEPPRLPTAAELAQRPNAADALKAEGVPEVARAYIGGGDPKKVPPELVAVLGDTRFRRFSDRGSKQGKDMGPLALSPDGKQIALSDGLTQIRFLDTATGRLMRQITCPKAWYYPMVFSADGRRLAGSTADGGFVVIDPQTGNLIWQLKPPGGPDPSQRIIAFSADGKTVFLNVAQGNLEAYDIDSGKLLGTWASEVNVALAVSPDGKTGLTITNRAQAWFYNLLMPREKARAVKRDPDDTGDSAADRVAFRPDGQGFAIAWRREGVTFHDRQGKQLHTLADKAGYYQHLAFTTDSKTLLTVTVRQAPDPNSKVTRWDVASGRKLSTASVPRRAGNTETAISADGRLFVCQQQNASQIELFDTSTGKAIHANNGASGSISALAFSPDGNYLAGSDQHSIQLRDLATARQVAAWEKGNGPYLIVLAFSPDSKLLAAAAANGILHLYHVPSGEQVKWFETKITNGLTGNIAFSPDGQYVAAPGGGDTVRIWRIADGKERVLGYPWVVHAVAFSADGTKVLAAGSSGIKAWDTQTGSEIGHFLPKQYFYGLEWLPDGKTVAATTTGAIWQVNIETKKSVKIAPEPIPNLTNLFNFHARPLGPRGHLLCVAEDGFLLTQPGAEPARRRLFRLGPTQQYPNYTMRSAAFSPDGRYLACGNQEGIISLLRLSERGQLPEVPPAR